MTALRDGRPQVVSLARAYGRTVEGPLLVASDGFSPRYDLDRSTGIVTRQGHSLYGDKLAGRIVVFPRPRAGWPPAGRFLTSSRGASLRWRLCLASPTP